MRTLYVPPLGIFERVLDWMMLPIMYLLSGTFRESPQRTHRWNNVKLNLIDTWGMKDSLIVHARGDSRARARFWGGLPLFHMPIFGGWTRYVILRPSGFRQEWHVGWIAGDTAGVSRIVVRGPVRLLIGPDPVKFFGVSIAGTQIPLRNLGEGIIGQCGPFAKLPLL